MGFTFISGWKKSRIISYDTSKLYKIQMLVPINYILLEDSHTLAFIYGLHAKGLNVACSKIDQDLNLLCIKIVRIIM